MSAPMKLVVLGLSLSSAWGNGHATTYRALLRAFAARGHAVTFLERDVPWYASARDLADPPWCRLEFYRDLGDLARWQGEIAAADAVLVGSYVPEGVAVGQFVQRTARGATAFYDIDTPVTLAKLDRGDHEYVSPAVIPGYDVYLSFTGGPVLDLLRLRWGAPAAEVLYCSADAAQYRPVPGVAPRWDLSYLGTYSPDRQPVLERLLIEPARRAPGLRFVVAGAQYPAGIDWPANVERLEHVGPADHPAFYAASRFTLNVTRADMVRAGWSPSVRLFEAGACGTPVISDVWDGIETLFRPEEEILLATTPEQVLAVLRDAGPDRGRRIGRAARARVLAAHTAAHRAAELERHLRAAMAHHRHPAGASRSARAEERVSL
ncbi:CgeB family protein [Falsiroseomonas sp. CW058]|uniref:CgeB family protein n=1 Tax=Falsiroseomonas sp. CW058 TaxID=3388664 RepID=UPI003D316262